ncbi:MAG: nickel-dependent lactate racemase [Desulfobacter sp.]
MKFNLKYGDGVKAVEIPEKADVSFLRPETRPAMASVPDALDTALEYPLGCSSLACLLKEKTSPRIAVVVPDATLATPVKPLLSVVLEHIFDALPTLARQRISIIVGGGLHAPADRQIQEQLIPMDLAAGCTILSHDAEFSMVRDLGDTTRGTPVRINRTVADADFKLVIGQIDPHQFVGFTGGSKGVVVGCGAPETIAHNHSLMFETHACVGVVDGNPVREDLDEAGRMAGVDFAVNVVLNPDKQIVDILAGDPDTVLRQGGRTCAAIYGVSLEDHYDIVVASCGGTPKDSVLYQAQKGLNLSSHAVKKGGKILLLAACRHGIGDDIYFDYVCQFATPEAVLNDFRNMGFAMGAHKAYLFGRTLVDYNVAVFSDLDPSVMGRCHLRAADPSSIIREWVDGFEGIPRVAVIPYANTTYFYRPEC